MERQHLLDGKVRVHEAHLVLPALGDADHHVVDVRHDSADRGLAGAVAEPELSANEGSLLEKLKVDLHNRFNV